MDYSFGNRKSVGVSRRCIKLKGLLPSSPVPVPSQMNPIHTHIISFVTMRLNIIIPLTPTRLPSPNTVVSFFSGFPIKIVNAFLICAKRTKCPFRLLISFIALIFGILITITKLFLDRPYSYL